MHKRHTQRPVFNHCMKAFSFESQLSSSISGTEILTLCLKFFWH